MTKQIQKTINTIKDSLSQKLLNGYALTLGSLWMPCSLYIAYLIECTKLSKEQLDALLSVLELFNGWNLVLYLGFLASIVGANFFKELKSLKGLDKD